MRAKIVQEEMTHGDLTFYALRLETKNANLLLLSEAEDQLGTLAVAMPPAEKMIGPPVSSIMLGDRNIIIARLIAERLAHKTGKLALASVFTRLGDQDAGAVFLKLFDKTFEQEKEAAKK
ncbi:MAG TPA: proteasome assembly chaperone 4 family protein [Candidatus Bathyarchaeia archaeon]|nr:proteasome assembly chaperone 4 family protein [Candidatus Bathyarchaeia archaeon]